MSALSRAMRLLQIRRFDAAFGASGAHLDGASERPHYHALAVAAGELDEPAFAAWIRAHARKR